MQSIYTILSICFYFFCVCRMTMDGHQLVSTSSGSHQSAHSLLLGKPVRAAGVIGNNNNNNNGLKVLELVRGGGGGGGGGGSHHHHLRQSREESNNSPSTMSSPSPSLSGGSSSCAGQSPKPNQVRIHSRWSLKKHI